MSGYKDAGVDIAAGNKAVELIKDKVQHTFRLSPDRIITELGGFSAAVEMPDGRILIASTDGVGTKLAVGILLQKLNTVGIDLVAMCVNDTLAGGVQSTLFLDYIAMGKQTPERSNEIVEGIIAGCEMAGCALIGGEMAEMPGFYEEDEFDLAGFSVGLANSRNSLILGDAVTDDMYVYGLLSSGLHSNGFSLYRKLFNIYLDTPESSIKELNKYYGVLGRTIGKELLTPTKIYVNDVMALINKYEICGLANITGGGLVENPVRCLPDGYGIVLETGKWPRLPIFDFIQRQGNQSFEEMVMTTNYGIGFMVISPEEIEDDDIFKIGRVVNSSKKEVYFQ